MAYRAKVNEEVAVTLAATCTQLVPVFRAGQTYLSGRNPRVGSLVVYESDVGVYLILIPRGGTAVADGAALPTANRRNIGTITAGSPFEIDVTPYETILIAGTGAGTARLEFRA